MKSTSSDINTKKTVNWGKEEYQKILV